MTGISVLIASSGRPTLPGVIDDVAPQLAAQDQLIVDVNVDSPWGHRARNRMMQMAHRGNLMVFYDDDDRVHLDALATIRHEVARTDPSGRSVHIFRMHHKSSMLWRDREVRLGNVSTQMVVVPAERRFTRCRWGDRYEGDFDFIRAACRVAAPIWHQEIVAFHNGRRQAEYASAR